MAEIANTVTASIRTAQPVYSVIPEIAHRAAVEVQVRNKLRALSEQRGLSTSELEAATDLAAERAAGGIPIDALIAAYQAADTVIWRIVVERSTPEVVALLPRIGTLMFEAISETTTAMAGAHSSVARAIDGGRITLAHHFLECLEDPEQRSAASTIAVRLHLDPAGDFIGLVWRPDSDRTDLAGHGTVSTLPPQLADDVVSRSVAGGRMEMITQSERVPALVASGVAAGALEGLWGVGLARRGLDGAGQSLGDARLALGCSSADRPIRTFEDAWYEAVVLAERARFDVLLAPAVGVARAHPHLAETIIAFAAADMSIAATAPVVHVHANSVTYRLDRWSRLTGLEARSFDGLSRSVIACHLAGTAHD
ncbi:MAG TPA: helix-turn-helix domain-containing protein [Nocardioides sp.]